ncbi:extensin family protein [Litorimonas sp. RW-G-Af-16]|uniref:extensin-like domain-containing protein n=1 Tax=Litorimonas sp. RW-G-Af-16 TaxID=3241168 RepID=UPI00390C7440
MPAWLERQWPWLVWIIFAAIIGIGVAAANRYIPKQHLPWAKLDPTLPLGFGTKSQLLRLSLEPSETCMTLARDITDFETIPSEPKGPKGLDGSGVCGWKVARLVYGSDDTVLAPGEANMQCPLSVGTYLWMRELDVLAVERFGVGLAKIHHMGTYSCRRQRGNGSGKWSEHAFGNAWDVAAFELEDKTLISVKSDWADKGDEGAYLREARRAACKIFKVTLSPDYNAAHHDHFHLDMGPSSSCR